jgi:hypothetical protein
MAALLTPLVRPLISGPTPIFLIDKPSPGTGATLLVSVIATVGLGALPALLTMPRSPAELEKTIFAALLGGARVMVFDNVTGQVDHAALAAVLTSDEFSARRLGVSEMAVAPNNAIWFMTANNAHLSQEIARRTVYIRLDAQVEVPAARSTSRFKHPRLKAHVLEYRDRYVGHALTLVRHWIAMGRPTGNANSFGGYETWSETLDGVLTCLGFDDFLANEHEVRRNVDGSSADWTEFLEQLLEHFGVRPFTARELAEAMVTAGEGLRSVAPAEVAELFQVGSEIATRLGRLLAKRRDQVFGDYRLVFHRRANSNVNAYRVETVNERKSQLRRAA